MPGSSMLYSKVHGNLSTGSGQDFLRVFNIHAHGGHLCHVTNITVLLNFHFLILYLKAYIQNLLKWPSGF